jgi:hypothetical protein
MLHFLNEQQWIACDGAEWGSMTVGACSAPSKEFVGLDLIVLNGYHPVKSAVEMDLMAGKTFQFVGV